MVQCININSRYSYNYTRTYSYALTRDSFDTSAEGFVLPSTTIPTTIKNNKNIKMPSSSNQRASLPLRRPCARIATIGFHLFNFHSLALRLCRPFGLLCRPWLGPPAGHQTAGFVFFFALCPCPPLLGLSSVWSCRVALSVGPSIWTYRSIGRTSKQQLCPLGTRPAP